MGASQSAERDLGRSVFTSALALFLIGTAEVIAGPMMTRMGADFAVSSARISWLSGSYALVYALLAPLLGPVSDRIGRKQLLLPGLVGLGAALFCVALAPSFAWAIAASAGAGVSAAAIQPNALAVACEGVPSEKQAAVTGRVFVGLTSSFVAVPVVAALLAARVNWRAMYLLAGIAALTCAVLAQRLPATKPSGLVSPSFVRGFKHAFATPVIRRRLAASFLWLGLSVGLSAILAEVIRRRFQLSIETTGVLVGAFGVCTMFGNALAGRVGRMGYDSNRIVGGGILASAVGCLVVGVLPQYSRVLAVIAGACWALGYGVAGPFHHASLSAGASSPRVTVTAIHASLLNLGVVSVAYGAGRFFDSAGVEGVVAAAAIGMVVAWFLLREPARTPLNARSSG